MPNNTPIYKSVDIKRISKNQLQISLELINLNIANFIQDDLNYKFCAEISFKSKISYNLLIVLNRSQVSNFKVYDSYEYKLLPEGVLNIRFKGNGIFDVFIKNIIEVPDKNDLKEIGYGQYFFKCINTALSMKYKITAFKWLFYGIFPKLNRDRHQGGLNGKKKHSGNGEVQYKYNYYKVYSGGGFSPR